MKRTICSLLLLGAVALAALQTAPTSAADAQLPTYAARYAVEYKGRKLGFAVFSMTYDAPRDTYRFESRTVATGLIAKLLLPNPAVERSEFVLSGSAIVPTSFKFEDGSRKGGDNVTIEYDWTAGTASVTSEAGLAQLPLQAGVLDSGAIQIALMHDLMRQQPPGPYVVVDGESLKTYRYEVGDRESVQTPAGTFDALTLVQQREGSSRTTLLWVAPELDYLPVRIEQLRDGEVQTLLALESVEGL